MAQSDPDRRTEVAELAFEPIARETVSSQIRAQLLRRITMGELAPGHRMPSERDLADQFAVARTSVREAMQGLLSLGVVERRGNRSFVAEHLPEVQVRGADGRRELVAELFETRRVLEVPIFELAAVRAEPALRARVAELAARFHDDLEIEEFRRLDREFHTTLASGCGNPLLIELYGKVLDRLFRSREFAALLGDAANRPEVRRLIADSGTAHRAIAAAFAEGDGGTTRAAVLDHVGAVEHALLDDLL